MSRKNNKNDSEEESDEESSSDEESNSEEETVTTKKTTATKKEESSSESDESNKKAVKFAKGTKEESSSDSSSGSSSDEDSDEESSSSDEETAKKKVVKKVVVKKPTLKKVVKKVVVKKKSVGQSPRELAGITITDEELAKLRSKRFLVPSKKEGPEVELIVSSKDEKKNQESSPVKIQQKEARATESGCTSSFALPSVGSSHGWGPDDVENVKIAGIPYAAFSRGDKVAKIADFTASARNPRQMRGFGTSFAAPDTFAYKQEVDENSFSLVDRGPKKKKQNRFTPRQKWTHRNPRSNFNRNRSRGGRRPWNNRGKRWNQRTPVNKDPSVKVDDNWKLLFEIEFDDLPSNGKVIEGEDLESCGEIKQYSRKYDWILPKTAVPLTKKDVSHITASTSEDPVLQKFIQEKKGTVYATDTILGALMACKCSRLSWDLIVKKTEDGDIILDKRKNSKLDYVTVNENWNDAPQAGEGDINNADALSREATEISFTYAQQCLDDSTEYKLGGKDSPFLQRGDKLASAGYRYRSFQLNEDTVIVARTTVDAYLQTEEGRTNVGVRALSQFDPRRSGNVDWTKKLDTQAGSILATELKNNSNKITRWIAEMSLAGCQEIRLGFVSRKHPTNADQHVVLYCKRYHSLLSFSTTARVRAASLWGTLEGILDMLKDLPAGTFLMMRDPVDPKFSIYEIPENSFEHESGQHWESEAEENLEPTK